MIIHRLEQPAFAPYLGRRACIPDEPLVLRGLHPNPVNELLTRVPLSLPAPPRPERDTVPVDFIWEHSPEHVPAANVHRELADAPANFTPNRRLHHTRRIWRTTEQLPTTLYTAQPTINALAAYIQQDTHR